MDFGRGPNVISIKKPMSTFNMAVLSIILTVAYMPRQLQLHTLAVGEHGLRWRAPIGSRDSRGDF